MFEFIKRNKIFSGCFALCLIVIIGLGGYALIQRAYGNDEPIVLPPIIDPDPEEEKDPQISLFSGEFEDEENIITLTWDFQMNNHSFQKLELYRDDTLIDTFYDERETKISIFDFDLSTGPNEFELRLYYDEGIVVSKEASVMIEYVFDVEMSWQPVDNNLGKGYLFSVKYHYNANTPAGIPEIFLDPTLNAGTWDAKYIGKTSLVLQGDYRETEAFYMAKLNEFPDEDVIWHISYNFKSVGVRVNDTVTDNPAQSEYSHEDMEISF